MEEGHYNPSLRKTLRKHIKKIDRQKVKSINHKAKKIVEKLSIEEIFIKECQEMKLKAYLHWYECISFSKTCFGKTLSYVGISEFVCIPCQLIGLYMSYRVSS